MTTSTKMPSRESQPSDATFTPLLMAARAGETEALNALLARFYSRVDRYVSAVLERDLRRTRDWLSRRFSTGDVVQEVFRSVITDLSGFRGATEEEFFGYVSRIVRNRILDALRYHEAERRDVRLTAPERHGDGAAPIAGPVTVFEAGERRQLYEAALASFPEHDQALLRRRLEDQIEFSVLTAELGFGSDSATRRAFYAAQAKLVVRLRQFDPDDDR